MDPNNKDNTGSNSGDLYGDNNPEGLDLSQDNQSDIALKRDEKGRLVEGTPPGPGRPKLTEEQKVIKKALKELVTDYKEGLAQVLPKISPILMDKALKGDMVAIKEIHAIVVGEAPKDITSGGKPLNFKPFDDIQENKSLQDNTDVI